MNKSKKIYVYDNFTENTPLLMGYLYVDIIKGKEAYSFEYDENWLSVYSSVVNIDPDLAPFSGRQYSNDGEIFGLFADCSPDRWGRLLMIKRERNTADRENRNPNRLLSSDFLLGVYDKTRMGGIRLKLLPDGSFLSDDTDEPIPAWTTLRELEYAARNFETEKPGENKALIEQLIRPGSSLGGARPKATVIDTRGDLWIAKFPSHNDENNTGAWEKVASDLAKMCGLNVPESKLEKFSKYGSTFLIKRFDREGEKRIHFASAMTLLRKRDGASAVDGSGYLDIVSFIKANGSNPKGDLEELWRRIVFNMAVSNTDDHLRNHAFIFDKNGWRLSPLYDVNPVPYGNALSLNVSQTDNTISKELALAVSYYFGIEKSNAVLKLENIVNTVRNNWESLAKKYNITRKEIEDMRPAFYNLQ